MKNSEKRFIQILSSLSLKKVSVLILVSTLSLYGRSQSQTMQLISAPRLEAKFKFENDTSISNLLERWTAIARYEFTFTGVQDLPLIPEVRKIEAVSYRDAIEQALGAYRNSNSNIVMEARMDTVKKQLYVSTSKLAPKVQKPPEALPTGFTLTDNDKSMMQVFVRWATQVGYQSYINDQPVNLQVFPRHVSRYPDYSLIPVTKTFKTQSQLKDAISQFIALYTGISLDPFTVRVDDVNKKLYIVGLVKY